MWQHVIAYSKEARTSPTLLAAPEMIYAETAGFRQKRKRESCIAGGVFPKLSLASARLADPIVEEDATPLHICMNEHS